MHVTRLADAKPYEAPKHAGCTALRLHGFDTSPVEAFNVGLSHFLPGGGVERDVSPLEKVDVVTEGEVTIITDEGEATLGPYDSVYLAPNEASEPHCALVNGTGMLGRASSKCGAT